MSVLEWTKVNLFELRNLPSNGLHNIYSNISAHCFNLTKAPNGSSSLTTVLCDNNGYIHVLQGSDKQKTSFKCNDNCQLIKLCALTTNKLLVVVTQEREKYLNIYIYDLMLSKKDGYQCISTTFIPAKSAATFIQAEVLDSDKTFVLAIGFEKGDIMLHFGNVIRDSSLNMRHHTIASSSINGIQFQISQHQADLKMYNMFVTCLNGVYCFVLNDKGTVESKLTLDYNQNIHSHCCTISKQIGSESFLVVGRDDAIFCFTRDGRGPCFAIKGQKDFLSWIGHHLVIVVKKKMYYELIVVDVDIKLIVLHEKIKNLVCITSDNNSYHIITKDENSNSTFTYNSLKLQEYSTTEQIRILLSNSMHDNALRIIERIGSSSYKKAAIVRLQHGNNLLQKGLLNRAVEEYGQTIGVTKPSDIITKLLCSRHNNNLKNYLVKLVDYKNVKDEHKQMLESCVTRENLNLRIQQLWDSRKDPNHICDFRHQSVQAINDSLLAKAKHHLELNETIVSIFDNSNEADILNFFLEYGRELLAVHSTLILRTIELLGKRQQIKNILSFLSIFLDNPETCKQLLTEVVENNTSCDEKLHYYLLTLYLGLWREKKIPSQDVLDFCKKLPLKHEKILLICKAYFFYYQGNVVQDSNDFDLENCDNAELIQYIQSHKSVNSPSLVTRQRSLLMILQKVCTSGNIKISDVKSHFVKQFEDNLSATKSELQQIKDLETNIKTNGSLLSQYKNNAIEFCSNSCDKCHDFSTPLVYFLCKHTFHKDCQRFMYSATKSDEENICVLCSENKSASEYSQANASSDVIREISNAFASGIFLKKIDTGSTELFNRQASVISRNPFDENYDSNFNVC